MKVFILDDDEEWIEMFRTVLQNSGQEVHYFLSPDEANRAIRDVIPDIVISDYVFKGAGIRGDALLNSEMFCTVPIRAIYSHNHFDRDFQSRLCGEGVRCFWKRITGIEELCGILGIIALVGDE